MIQCEVMEDLGLLGLNNIQHITVITYNSSFYRSCYCIFIFILLHKHTIEYFPQRSINRISHYPFYILKLLFPLPCHYIFFFSSSFIQTAILNLKSFSLIKGYCPCIFLIYIQKQFAQFIFCITQQSFTDTK